MLVLPLCAVGQEDTVVFTYDENDSTLSINAHKGDFIYIEKENVPNGLEMFENFKKESNCNGYSSLYFKEKILKEKITSFDSTEYAKLNLKKLDYNSAITVIPTLDLKSKITIVRKTKSAPTQPANSSTPAITDNKTGINGKLSAVASIAALTFIILTIVILRRKKRKKSPKSTAKRAEELGLEVVEVVSSELKNGLDYIHGDRDSYYLMEIAADYNDTAVQRIYLHHTAVKKMYDFFKEALESSEQTMETGCYFVGCWEKDSSGSYSISVEDIVKPGNDIEPGEFSFNFGKEIGLNLYQVIDEKTKECGRDIVHTVWMHSHPGLGLFLSSHDLLVQRQLTYSDEPNRLAAFVIDTNTPDWQFAVFTAKTSGSMNNKEDNPRIYSLDELYQWSRTIHQKSGNRMPDMTVSEPENKENYYAAQINHQGGSKTLNIYVSGKTINQIDDILYKAAGKQTVVGWLVGENEKNGNLVIDSCEETEVSSTLGILAVDSQRTADEIIAEYGNGRTCLMVCRENDELWIFSRKDSNTPFDAQRDLTITSMRPMKEWLRRRRIYK